MDRPDLRQFQIINPQLRKHLGSRQTDQALAVASLQAAGALSDLGLAELAAGNLESAIQKIENAMNLSPGCQPVFHNLLAVLLVHGRLRGPAYLKIREHLFKNRDKFPWAMQYRQFMYAPSFLNIEFVGGKCNLKCRMCQGTNRPDYEKRLAYISVADFRKALDVAPTVSGVTLSSGDSDPLMHPHFDQIIQIAAEHGIGIDMFTNGQLLTDRLCGKMIDSGAVNCINFSIDAATPETYRKVRGANLDRLIEKIQMLQAMKKEKSRSVPWIALSFVAMADTIHELPDFVDLAHRLGAGRVYVEDLSGWDDRPSDNHPATDNPKCYEFIREARRRIRNPQFKFELAERLRHDPSGPRTPIADASFENLECCSWLSGVWVQRDGKFEPCCLVARVADMGSIHEGPVIENEKFARVKNMLMGGKVFKTCLKRRMCQYVQQQKAAGNTLRTITREELGELYIEPDQDNKEKQQDGDAIPAEEIAETS